jgi:hypothetical protein
MACVLLTTACGTEATGECRGTHLGESVNWPIDDESARLVRTISDRYENRATWLFLKYLPGGSAGLTSFGAHVQLVDGVSIDAQSGSRTVQLVKEESDLSPEEDSLVVGWEGRVGTQRSYGSGYPEASGVPMAGSLTLDVVDSDHAEGRFVYRYADGNELTCTFNVPTPAAADGALGGDDEDDDD